MLADPIVRGDNPIQCLTQTQAELRSSLVLAGSISYDLSIKLLKGPLYQGLITIRFFALSKTDEVFLDFTGRQIRGLSLNGVPSSEVAWDGNFIQLPGVKQGRNEVIIYYENKYDNDGNGLHSFIDEDSKQYLYTNLAVIYCRRVFPSFDQPDLKSSFTLQAIAPNDWIVLSNETPADRQNIATDFNENLTVFSKEFIASMKDQNDTYYLINFPESKPLPSYLFGIMAGPYAHMQCEKTYKNIPMGLYTRESLMPYLARIADFIFEVTNKCMEVYERIFGYAFPFNKYDQIYVPEFNWGAMENAGIVTFNDTFVFKEEVDSVKLTRLANTTSHELSHHWFGNLVTMKWWNDVWLNESFADFISHYCLSQITTSSKPMSDIWVAFNVRKAWGYRTDEQVTTHPIAGIVPDTNTAETVFDGITYAKGAATLRQLFSLVSVDHFSSAMKEYFTKYAFKNTTLAEFINTVDEQFQQSGSTFSLASWQKQWIGKAGLNKCCAAFDPACRDAEATLKVQQTCVLDMHPTLRNHKMQVAFFDENAAIAHTQDILLLDQAETDIKYDASKTQFQAALLNYNDEAFIKIAFDSHSIQFFKKNLNKIDSELSRTLIWQAFYNMVRDGELSSEEYIDLFISHINLEKSEGLISNQLSFLELAFKTYTPSKYQPILGDRLFDFLWVMLSTCPESQTNKKLALIGALPSFAKSESRVRKLLEWYNGTALSNATLGIKTKWEIIKAVFNCKTISDEEKQTLLAQQSALDTSDQKLLYQRQFNTIIAKPDQREAIWDDLIDPKNTASTRTLEYALAGFAAHSTAAEALKYHLKWLEALPEVFTNCKRELFKAFALTLQPSQETQNEVFSTALSQALEKHSQTSVIQKVLFECRDNNTRRQRAVATFNSQTKIQLE